ncbi:MAG: serine protease [Clostridiales bacterium]|nr:serine protease [Clostridiales bacterium]
MAKYRIVRSSCGKAEYLGGGFYWKELTKEQARDLDIKEIRELNQLPEEETEPEETGRITQGIFILFTLLMVLVFLFSSGLPSLKSLINMPDFSFLARSGELAKDDVLLSLKEAVVTIKGASSSGSGFNLRADGLIVTNRHVVENNIGVMVTFSNGKSYAARTWQYVGDYDLAVAVIAGKNLPHVELGNELPQADDPLIFIGNPLGFDWTISEGVMREMWAYGRDLIIYFSGPVYSGSSGSPLFNSEGQVIGVIFASLRDVENSGLAIPAQLLLSYIDE